MQMEGANKNPEQQIRSEVMRAFTTFMQQWPLDQAEKKYKNQAKNAIHNAQHHIIFSFTDLMHYNSQLATLIFDEYYKYESALNEALTQFMKQYEKTMIHEEGKREEENKEQYECSFDDGYK